MALRLTELIEDFMDSRGGTEEQGLRIVVGISAWGVDAARSNQMVQNVLTATGRALASPVEPAIQLFRPLDSALSG